MIRSRTIRCIYKRVVVGQSNRALRLVYLELTHRCNFRCIHCYIREDNPQYTELMVDDYAKIVDQLKELQCLFVAITGGEPLLHPQFFEIYRLLKSSGFFITIMTNAYCLSEKHFKLFSEMPPFSIDISLYGFEQSAFKQITQTKLDSNIVKSNIETLLANGLRVSVKSVLLNYNYNELELYREFARKHKIKFRYDVITHNDIYGLGRGGINCSLKTANAAILQSKNLRIRKQISKDIFNSSADNHHKSNDDIKYFKCGLGKNILVIDPYGYGHPCLLVRNGQLNIRNHSARAIIQFNTDCVSQMRRKYLKCDSCVSKKSCSWCEGVFYINQNTTDHIGNYCELTQKTVELVVGKKSNTVRGAQ